METRELLQILREELLRRRLPCNYVERITAELADHAADIAREAARSAPTSIISGQPDPSSDAVHARSTDLAQRLGDPVHLADKIVDEFQRRTFLGRHPWVTFVALPASAMAAAWLTACLFMGIAVRLILQLGGHTPSDAWRWAAALVAGTLAYGMTYGMPLLLMRWALGKVRQTTHAWSWVWTTTSALVLASFVFRLSIFPLDDGRFGIDASIPLRCVGALLLSCFTGENLPADWEFWRRMIAASFSFAYQAQVAILIGMTAFIHRRHRLEFATMVAANPSDQLHA